MRSFTHIGRAVDVGERSNRLMVWLSLGFAGGALLRLGDATPRSAIPVALTVFLTWALTRELDPDRPSAALVAAAIGGSIVIVTGDTAVAALGLAMVATRIVVRTTGLPPKLSDVVVVGVVAIVAVSSPFTWAAATAVAVAIGIDVYLSDPAPSNHVWMAVAIGVGIAAVAVVRDVFPDPWSPPPPPTWVAGAVVGLILLLAPTAPSSTLCDFTRAPIDPERLRWGRGLAVGVLIAAILGSGTPAGASVFVVMVAAGVAALSSWTRPPTSPTISTDDPPV